MDTATREKLLICGPEINEGRGIESSERRSGWSQRRRARIHFSPGVRDQVTISGKRLKK